MVYKKSGRKTKQRNYESKAVSKGRRESKGYGVSGHGNVHSKKLSRTQVKKIVETGGCMVKIPKVPKRRITIGNLFSDGHIEYYKRSDTKKIAVRRPGSDKKRIAGHKARRRKPMTGD